METDASLALYPESYQQSIRQYVETFLKQRNPRNFLGEFMDNEARQGTQYGLTGTSLLLFIARRESCDCNVTAYTKTILDTALTKATADRSQAEKQLTKDLDRLASKAIAFLLSSDDRQTQLSALNSIYRLGIADSLIKPVFDNSADSKGDPMITAFFLHVLAITGIRQTDEQIRVMNSIVDKLADELLVRQFSLLNRLFISTALCLHHYQKYISVHSSIMNTVYRSKHNYFDVLSSDAPFLERFYEDAGSEAGAPRNRYLRVPKGYVILAAIFLTTRATSEYFKFPMTRRILSEIRLPYDGFAHAPGERGRSAVYYVFFLYIALFPDRFLATPRPKLVARIWAPIRNRYAYYLGTLTTSGKILVVVFLLALLTLFRDFRNGTISVEAFEAIVAGLLGLGEPRRR